MRELACRFETETLPTIDGRVWSTRLDQERGIRFRDQEHPLCFNSQPSRRRRRARGRDAAARPLRLVPGGRRRRSPPARKRSRSRDPIAMKLGWPNAPLGLHDIIDFAQAQSFVDVAGRQRRGHVQAREDEPAPVDVGPQRDRRHVHSRCEHDLEQPVAGRRRRSEGPRSRPRGGGGDRPLRARPRSISCRTCVRRTRRATAVGTSRRSSSRRIGVGLQPGESCWAIRRPWERNPTEDEA